ncbi:hypothetical protein [Streptomyces sp. N50]|uniref:hypothetical protein n=1 Tax=Streptomyces sp. N50 TaxID=3081765 RepID=UPI002961EA37|nr:hypothetical protein [Streptomyces sp. N50]WOX07474.1 hypothetical protein R2B38_00765 [Streptomyces sp. N50]
MLGIVAAAAGIVGAAIGAGGAVAAARSAGRTTHDQWLRQVRREACSAFIYECDAQWRSLDTALDRISRGYSDEGQALLAVMNFEQAELRLGTVKLEASSAFVEKAEDMLGTLRDVHRRAGTLVDDDQRSDGSVWGDVQRMTRRRTGDRAMDELIELARKSLH